jgi:hypothetical protein
LRGGRQRKDLLVCLSRSLDIAAGHRLTASRARHVDQDDPFGIPLLESINRRELLTRIYEVRINVQHWDIEQQPLQGDRHAQSIIRSVAIDPFRSVGILHS